MSAGKRHTLEPQKMDVTSVSEETGDHAVVDHVASSDEQVLGALGYKQEFKR